MFHSNSIVLFFCIILMHFVLSIPLQAQLTPPIQDRVLETGKNKIFLEKEFSLPDEFTIESWFYLKKDTNGGKIIGKEINGDPHFHFVVQAEPIDGVMKARFIVSSGEPGSFTDVRSNEIALEEWIHVAATLEQNTIRLYVNGVFSEQKQLSFKPNQTFTDMMVGDTGHSPLEGYIRTLRIWNKALDVNEIIEVSERFSNNEKSLVADWNFNQEDITSQITDISGNGLDLTVERYFKYLLPRTVDMELIDNPFYEVHTFEAELPILNGILIDYTLDGYLDFAGYHQGIEGGDPYGINKTPLHLYKYVPEDSTFVLDTEHGYAGSNPEMFVVRDAVVADFNGDGFDDLFMAGHGTDKVLEGQNQLPGEQSRLFLQNGSGQLIDVSDTHLPQEDGLTHDIMSGDIDNDGDLDLLLGNRPSISYLPPMFFINEGNGMFAKTDFYKLPEDVLTHRINNIKIFKDFNRDGLLDIYGGRDDINEVQDYELYLINDGNGNFTIPPKGSVPVTGEDAFWGTMHAVDLDYNNDGHLDIVTSAFTQTIHGGPKEDAWFQLFENSGNGTFTDVSNLIEDFKYGGTGKWHYWIRAKDINNDGWTDFYSYGSQQDPFSFHINKGGKGFEKVPLDVFGTEFTNPPIFLAGDFDRDGNTDFMVLTGRRDGQILFNKRPYKPEPASVTIPEVPEFEDNSILESTDSLVWKTSSSPFFASDLQISNDENFNNNIVQLNDYSADYYPMTKLASGIEYFARVRVINSAGKSEWSTVLSFTLGVSVSNELESDFIPESFSLSQNYPNPFNPSTIINFQLAESSEVVLKVYDMLGREVATLLNERRNPGSHQVVFDASNLSSGVYIYRLEAGNNLETKKMMLIK